MLRWMMGPFVIYGALMAGATLAVFEARFPCPTVQGMAEGLTS